MGDLRPLLSSEKTAEILGVSEKVLRSLYETGQIARIHIGRGARRAHVAFDQEDIDRFIRQRKLAEGCEVAKLPAARRALAVAPGVELVVVRDFAVQKGNAKIKAKPEFVYFLRSGSLVKIGCSSNPRARLRQLTTGNAFGLRLEAVVAGGRKVEQELHRRFAAYRHQAEWFHCDGALAALISNLSIEFESGGLCG